MSGAAVTAAPFSTAAMSKSDQELLRLFTADVLRKLGVRPVTNHLPKPDQPYGSWTTLIQAALTHAFKPGNMDPAILGQYTNLIAKDVLEAFSKRPPESKVRPSSGINCAAIPWLVRNGAENERPGGNPLLFATGHFHHNLIYAGLKSAIGHAFVICDEDELVLPDWWPNEVERFTQEGHRDLRVVCDVDGWLAPNLPTAATFDVKTKHNLGMGQVCGKNREANLDQDIYGNLAQLSVYTQPGEDAYILYSNRECPSENSRVPQFKVEKVWADDLDEVRAAVEQRVTEDDFRPELWLRWQAKKFKGHFPCEKYCNYGQACAEERERRGLVRETT